MAERWRRRRNQLIGRKALDAQRLVMLEQLARQSFQNSGIRSQRVHRPIRAAFRLIGGLLLLVAIGTLLLMLPISSAHQPLAPNQALFTAVSALSTTGLSIITPGYDLSLFGQIVLLGLMEVGGIGFMVGAVLLFRALGWQVSFEQRLALRDSLGLSEVGSLLRIVRWVIVGVVTIEAIGALVLWILWAPTFGVSHAAYLAIWHAVSAFTNASFDLFSGAPDAPAGFPSDTGSLLTISTLVILGSIGIPVLSDLLRWPARRRLSLHSRITLITAGCLLLFGTVAIFIGESHENTLFGNDPWPRRLLLSYFHSATSRTSGFVLQPLASMDSASVLILTLLMFVGGSPASMGGGITTSTAAVLVLAMHSYIRGRQRIVVTQRTIGVETVQKAVAILVVALIGVMTVSWLLLLTQDQISLQEAVFETVSAFATCGFTLGLTPRLNLFGQLLIALTMMCGRLGALTVVAALTRRTPDEPVIYPEESILIG